MNKVIEPKLSVAHNFQNSQNPIYRFLCDLQFQNKRVGVQFEWGELENLNHFFPRVIYQNIILKRATWFLSRNDFQILFKKGFDAVSKWRDLFGLERFIVVNEGNQEMIIDLNSPIAVDILLHIARKTNRLKLSEFIHSNNGDHPKYNFEIIAPLFLNQKATSNRLDLFSSKEKTTRTFPPGSEWLYYKVYCGKNFSDELLATCIKPFLEENIQQYSISKWFFIRYEEDSFHLRLRFHFNDLAKMGSFIKEFNYRVHPLIKEGSISNIMIDTYQRELERYGQDKIEWTEKIFFYDSSSFLEFINLNAKESTWKYGILSIDQYLNDCGFHLKEKREFAKVVLDMMIKEPSFDHKPFRNFLKVKTRALGNELKKVLLDDESPNKLKMVLLNRSTKMKPILNSLKKEFYQRDKIDLKNPFCFLLSSYIHMSLNRIFKDKQRYNEIISYNLLKNFYDNQLWKKS